MRDYLLSASRPDANGLDQSMLLSRNALRLANLLIDHAIDAEAEVAGLHLECRHHRRRVKSGNAVYILKNMTHSLRRFVGLGQRSIRRLRATHVQNLRFATLVALLWCLLLSACDCQSPYPWATYRAIKRTHPITIDGDLSDWSGVPGFTMADPKFIFVGQGMSAAKWGGPKDLSATFRVVWDEEYLYMGVEVTDDHVTEPHGSLVKDNKTGSWDDDSVEVMVDEDGCCTRGYYIGDLAHHEFHFVYSARHPFVFDNFWVPKPGAPAAMTRLPDGSLEPISFPGEEMAKHDVTAVFSKWPYNGAFAFKRTAVGYNLELRMALPKAKMAAIDKGGHPIGFDIAINDNDLGEGPRKQQLHWSGMNGMYWRDTKYLGTLILVEK